MVTLFLFAKFTHCIMEDRVRYEDGLHIHTGNWPSGRLAPLQDVRAPVASETER